MLEKKKKEKKKPLLDGLHKVKNATSEFSCLIKAKSH